MPGILLRPSTTRFRRRSNTFTIRATACSDSGALSASIAAICVNPATHEDELIISWSSFAARALGATAYPNLHPVIAYDLDNPSMSTVRSLIPGCDKGDTCWNPYTSWL